MNKEKIIRIIGIILFIAGSLDPLEGSVLILPGSILIAISAYLSQIKYSKLFITSSSLIFLGVVFMFYFSSLGGFGGKSALSWWWGVLIIPYPIGWLIMVVMLILQAVKKYILQSKV